MGLSIVRFGLLGCVVFLASFGALPPARASGPVERLVQVMVDPSDPERVVLRYGAASEGFLFSEDGGHSFRATCTTAIAPELKRISRSGALYMSPALLDGAGHVLVSTFDALWSDDGTGCAWAKQAALDGKWVASARTDPAGSDVFAIVNTSTGTGESREARSELMRRDASGTWSSAGLLKAHVATQRAFGADLVAASTTGGRRLYASVTVSVGPVNAPQETSVVVSDDGGQNWRQGSVLPDDQATLVLLAVDPMQPDRVLAAVSQADQADRLLLSEDQGKTFTAYAEIEEFSGVTFAPDGRVFIGDTGTGATGAVGGVWTAARLGEALARVPAPAAADNPGVDCIGYDAASSKLQVCKLDRFGLLDPESGAFEELTRFEAIAQLLSCPGTDLLAACEAQFNEGASWCCAGHYPFTAFCADYDITEQDGRPVSCGLTGRAVNLAAGRGPTLGDAGAPDAGGADAVPGRDAGPTPELDSGSTPAPEAGAGTKRKASGGCQLARAPGESSALSGLFAGLCALALARAGRRMRAGRMRGERS